MLNIERVPNRRWKSDLSLNNIGSPSEILSEAHVLAVDDSLIDRKVIQKLLQTTSCKVTAVDSGISALEFLGLHEQHKSSIVNGLKIDLIITDYCMPGMTGYELLKKIKESSTFKETPVVIMSSENVIARIDRCLEEGAEDFILKPVKLSDVKRLRDYMTKDDQSSLSNGRQQGTNKRKQMDGLDETSLSPAQSTPSTSSPSSPCGPLDSPIITPSEPLDRSTDDESQPLDSPSRRLKLTLDKDHKTNCSD